MYSVPGGEVRDHFRGTWNAPIADSQHSSGMMNYNTPMPETIKGADPRNPFDNAFAELSLVNKSEVDPHFKAHLASTMAGPSAARQPAPHYSAAPAAFPGSTSSAAPTPARPAPRRAPPARRASYTGQMQEQQQQLQPFESAMPTMDMYSQQYSPNSMNSPHYASMPSMTSMQSPDMYSSSNSATNYSPQSQFGSSSPNDLFRPDSYTGSFGMPSARTEFTEISDPAGSSTWDPFLGESYSSKSGVERKCDDSATRSTEEDDYDEDDDEDSDLDDEDGCSIVFDDGCLGQAIPASFASETVLKEFLLSPLESEKLVKCVIMFDNTEKVWTFINQSNGMRLMTAFKRTDGLKRLTTSMQWAISYAPRAVEGGNSLQSMGSRYGSWSSQKSGKAKASAVRTQDTFIAKMKSNVNGSSFEVFDTGLNPSKALGAMHARRELGAIRIDKQSGDQYRRKLRACIPAMGHNRRPLSKKELMFERLAQGDHTVFPLANHMPDRVSYLPRLADFRGMALASSVKNTILHNPEDRSGEDIFVLGKTSKRTFNCYFREPMSPAMAFAISLASISSYVNAK